jgi:hypothetical protein
MEPFAINAGPGEWEFRCHSKEVPGHPWDWQCRLKDGSVVARSKGYFRSLHEAVADAVANGFTYEPPPRPATALGYDRTDPSLLDLHPHGL